MRSPMYAAMQSRRAKGAAVLLRCPIPDWARAPEPQQRRRGGAPTIASMTGSPADARQFRRGCEPRIAHRGDLLVHQRPSRRNPIVLWMGWYDARAV